MENRKKLTDVQFASLINAQLRYENSLAAFNKAKENLNNAQENLDSMTLLIVDTHGLPVTSKISVDTSTKELIITE